MRRAALASMAITTVVLAACDPAREQETMEDWAPNTDIYLTSAVETGSGLTMTEPTNITARDGYDNQPNFLPDGSGFLYTAIREDHQADTYHYDIDTGTIERVTASLSNEFSPTVMPDGEGFSTVRDEPDGLISRLWRFRMDGRSPRVLLRDLVNVGYHTWVDPETVGLFVYGMDRETREEFTRLEIVDVATGDSRVVAENIGRCLQPVPGARAVAYVDKNGDGPAWHIRYLDVNSGRYLRTLPARPNAEDFVIRSDGSILMAEEGRLYLNRPGSDEWEMIADWTAILPGHITRVTASPRGDRVALVVKRS